MPSSSSSRWPQPAVLANIGRKSQGPAEMGNSLDSDNLDDSGKDNFRVLALYKFVSPPIPKETLPSLQSEIETVCREYGARGTLILAEEGINGTICYPYSEEAATRKADDDLRTDIDKDALLTLLQEKLDQSLRIRISKSDRPIFARLKIRIKSEIVTMHWEKTECVKSCNRDEGAPSCCPTQLVGEYVQPKDWNELLLDPETLVVDTRNEYEVEVGTFRNAVNPHTQSFIEFPEWMRRNLSPIGDGKESGAAEHRSSPKKIAMFCTGGIRCEKATNACLQLVPSDVLVYHLEGGILAYLNEIPPEESLFDGDCYVFDQRVAVTYGLQPSKRYSDSCHGCRHPLSADDLQHEDHVPGISCRYCVGKLSEKQQERFAQRQRQIELAMKEGRPHIYDPKELSRRS